MSTTRIARSTNNGDPPSFDLFPPAVVATAAATIGRGACRSAIWRGGADCSIIRAGGRAGGGRSISRPFVPASTMLLPAMDGVGFIPPRGEGKIVVAAVETSSSFSSISFSFDSTSTGSRVSSIVDEGASGAGVHSRLASNPQAEHEYSRDLFGQRDEFSLRFDVGRDLQSSKSTTFLRRRIERTNSSFGLHSSNLVSLHSPKQ